MRDRKYDVDSRDQRGIESRARVDEYARWIWERIVPYVNDRVLEVGCGAAMMVPWIEASCDRYLGIDVAENLVEENRRQYSDRGDRIRFLRANILSRDRRKTMREFNPDTIVCLNVLEHLEEDRRAVEIFEELLQPGGSVIVQVPAYPWLYGSQDRAGGHVRRYRREGLQNLLDTFFHEVDVEAFNPVGILPWWFNGQVLRREAGYFENLSHHGLSMLNRLIPALRRFDSFLSLPFGLSFFGFARKGSGTS